VTCLQRQRWAFEKPFQGSSPSFFSDKFSKLCLHWWGSHGIALVPWISPTLWSGATAEPLRRHRGATAENALAISSWKSGNLEIHESGNQTEKYQNVNPFRPNVLKILISREKSWSFWGQFSHGSEKKQNYSICFAYFPWWSNRALFTKFGVMCWCRVVGN